MAEQLAFLDSDDDEDRGRHDDSSTSQAEHEVHADAPGVENWPLGLREKRTKKKGKKKKEKGVRDLTPQINQSQSTLTMACKQKTLLLPCNFLLRTGHTPMDLK